MERDGTSVRRKGQVSDAERPLDRETLAIKVREQCMVKTWSAEWPH